MVQDEGYKKNDVASHKCNLFSEATSMLEQTRWVICPWKVQEEKEMNADRMHSSPSELMRGVVRGTKKHVWGVPRWKKRAKE